MQVENSTSVENSSHNGPVIVGYGTRGQEGQLREAGAERVFRHPDQLATVIEFAGVMLSPGDILLMVQPGILKAREYEKLHKACSGDLMFQVVGREPFPLKSVKHFAEFRKVKPVGVSTEILPIGPGRPRTIDYTMEQAEAIIRLWHEVPRRSPSEVTEITKKILGLPDDYDMKPSWPRDLVIKYVGTARREKPVDWQGIKEQ